ncbi:Inositol polyphosphate multikinase [Hondaea fermentalgiana]|uniref:Kinase n=1 Tax=Hondaea fermentalgiana TaxID=2315210 RepID=A0A2R5GWN7_9STRA|nr:Inositol polyphosphate multikinase [Hondaea fermentalgiana]|eukprot:GBG34188.1 Inositol polyphosphate multikinase [Hondaea fermentalgiana]
MAARRPRRARIQTGQRSIDHLVSTDRPTARPASARPRARSGAEWSAERGGGTVRGAPEERGAERRSGRRQSRRRSMASDAALKALAVAAGACALAYLVKKRREEAHAAAAARREHADAQAGASMPAALDAVGGHGSKKDKGPPILVRDGAILKPFQPAQPGKGKSRGELEAEFYKEVSESESPLKAFIPKYLGLEKLHDAMYLKLENMTYGLECPCVLDLKMGQQTYDETASPEKIAKEKKKYPPQEKIGFRIVGMKVYRRSKDEWWKSSRDWAMSITEDSMTNAIEKFFDDGQVVRYGLMGQLVEELDKIESMLRETARWRMYGSSLFVVYDGKAERPELRVRMIDFAHVFPIRDGGVDDGYLHGVQFLRGCLNSSLSLASSHHAAPAQVGGAHGNISSKGGEIIKREDKKEQFDVEVDFYRKAWDPSSPDSLSRVMPRLIRVDESTSPRELVISDATESVRRKSRDPMANEAVSIMDVKLGLRSFRSDCPNEPKSEYYNKYATFETELSPGRAEEIWETLVGDRDGPASLSDGKLGKRDYLAFRDATTTSRELGFRLTALVHGDYRVSQADSRSVETRIQFLEGLEHYLYNEDGFSLDVAEQFVNELSKVQEALSESRLFRRYELVGTSLLFLHANGKAAIRFIDFANSTPSDVADRNGVLQGVQRLTMAIEELIMKYRAPQ